MSATSGDYGVTIPSAPTVNANPGAVPDPGVGTMSTSNTSLAKTFCVEAPVAFSVQTFGSLTRMESRVSMGTSVNVICHRSAPSAAYNLPLFWRKLARSRALVHGSRALGEPRSTSWPSWRQQVHDLDMKSSVHPKYKTKYHVGNWPAYDRALVQRGDITVWLAPDAIATWETVGVGKRGGQRQYSDLAIETALTLRLIFHLPLRQTEGFLTSIFGMLGLELSTPDHTTLSRRGQHLDLTLRRAPAGAGLHLMVDSTGLSIVGEGEWAAAKHGGRGRRGWKKLHLGVDRSGVIVARALTEASVDDATTGITLIEAVDGALGRVTADTAYDTIGFYEAAGARGATVVVPPTRTANVSRHGPRSRARGCLHRSLLIRQPVSELTASSASTARLRQIPWAGRSRTRARRPQRYVA